MNILHKSVSKENKTNKKNKILFTKLNLYQIIFLLLIFLITIYYPFSEVLKFINSSVSNFKESASNSKQKNNSTRQESKPKNSLTYPITNVVKVKNYYFLNGENFVDFRSEKGNVLYLELKEGIEQSKFNSLLFTTDPTEPIEVKLEKANFIAITYTGEFKAGFTRNFLTIKDGITEVYKVSYYNFSEDMFPNDDYVPPYIP